MSQINKQTILGLKEEYKNKRNEISNINLSVWKKNKLVLNKLRGKVLVYEKIVKDLERLLQ